MKLWTYCCHCEARSPPEVVGDARDAIGLDVGEELAAEEHSRLG